MPTDSQASLLVVAACNLCIFARMRLPVCEHPAVTFGASAHGSLLWQILQKQQITARKFWKIYVLVLDIIVI